MANSSDINSRTRYIFTSRSGGESAPPFDGKNLALHVGDQGEAVNENRRALAISLGVDPAQLFFMSQVHGTTILEIDSASDVNEMRECDGLITSERGFGLAVLVADCAPVLLSTSHKVAAIHVGWRGLFGGIVEKALDLLLANDEASALNVKIGPTICGKCYEVGEDLAAQAKTRGFILGERAGKPTLDIPRSILEIVRSRLTREKIGAGSNGDWNGICTYESSEHFSFRREKVTGRQAGVIVRES